MLRDKHWSEEVARRAVWLSGLMSFESAARVMEKVGRVPISSETVWRLTRRWGEVFKQQEAQEQQQSKGIGSVAQAARQEQDARLGVALDGAMVNIRQEGWKELKVGCFFEVELHQVDDPITKEKVEVGHAVRNSYVGHLGGPEVFGEKVWAEASRRRWSHAAETQAIGDGAVWIWNLTGEHFYSSKQVVDWYHGMEHLSEAAKIAYGEGTTQANRWYKRQEKTLYEGDAGLVAQRIESLAEGHTAAEALRKQAGYFERNKHRMNYLELRTAGWVIGSGMVESGAKQFKARLTGPGMRWSRAGAERLVPLRASILSERFDDEWQAIYYNSPQN